jgi:hypothetical protein
LPKKDSPTLINCQNFGQNEDKNENIYDILHGNTEVHLHHDNGERYHPLKGSDECQRPYPLSAFFTFKKDVVYHLVYDGLQDEISQKSSCVDCDKVIWFVENKGVGEVCRRIEVADDGQEQACLQIQKKQEHVAAIFGIVVPSSGNIEEVFELMKEEITGMGIRHQCHDKAEEQYARYYVVAMDGVGYGVTRHTHTAARQFRVQQTILGKV